MLASGMLYMFEIKSHLSRVGKFEVKISNFDPLTSFDLNNLFKAYVGISKILIFKIVSGCFFDNFV